MYPFDIDKLSSALRALIPEEGIRPNWDEILKHTETELKGNPINLNLAFCHAYFLFDHSKNVHIDDLKEHTELSLHTISTYSDLNNVQYKFKEELDSILLDIEAKENEIIESSEAPIESLDLEQKKELAYQLNDKGGIKNWTLAAQLYQSIAESVPEKYNQFYNYGNSLICLYKSDQVIKADLSFDVIVDWEFSRGPSAYPTIIAYIFIEKLISLSENKAEFVRYWKLALNHKAIAEDDYFPYSQPAQNQLLEISWKLGANVVYQHLAQIFKEHRDVKSLSQELSVILNRIENEI